MAARAEHIRLRYSLNEKNNWILEEREVVKRNLWSTLYLLTDGDGEVEIEVLMGNGATVFLNTASAIDGSIKVRDGVDWQTVQDFIYDHPDQHSAVYSVDGLQGHTPIVRITTYPHPGDYRVFDEFRIWESFH